MDRKPCAPVVAAWIITSVTVGASDFWAVKDYTTWADNLSDTVPALSIARHVGAGRVK